MVYVDLETVIFFVKQRSAELISLDELSTQPKEKWCE